MFLINLISLPFGLEQVLVSAQMNGAPHVPEREQPMCRAVSSKKGRFFEVFAVRAGLGGLGNVTGSVSMRGAGLSI
jgi:hypothetical protein